LKRFALEWIYKMKKVRTFKHSGNLGDIIYALPTIKALGGGVLYIASGVYSPRISAAAPHPFPLSTNIVDQMTAFLKSQFYLKDVRPYGGEIIDYDLDIFREYVVSDRALWKVHLADWHLKSFHVQFDLCRPWLFDIAPRYVHDIVVTYSVKNESRDGSFNWRVLEDYVDKCVFLGFENEYYEFKKHTGLEINCHEAENITEFARVIRGSKLLISNQSFGFALTEAMKHPRVLDVLRLRSNALPQSSNGHIHIDKKIIDKYLSWKRIFSPPRFISRSIAQKMNYDYHKNIEGDDVVDS
jgi:hypothetical protein